MQATSTKLNLVAEQVHISSSWKTIWHYASTARSLQRNHYQVCHGLGCWGWACCTLYCHLQNGSPPANPHRHGVTATTKPYPNRQLNSSGDHKQDHCSKTIQNDGHETMVVKMLRLTKSISILLGCRLKKLGWLQHQTPSRYIPWSPWPYTCRYMEHPLGSPSMRVPVFNFFF